MRIVYEEYDNGARYKRTLGEAFGHGQHHLVYDKDYQPLTMPRVRRAVELIGLWLILLNTVGLLLSMLAIHMWWM